MSSGKVIMKRLITEQKKQVSFYKMSYQPKNKMVMVKNGYG